MESNSTDEVGFTVAPEMGLRVLEDAKEGIYEAFEGLGDSPASAVSTAIVGYSNAIARITELETERDATLKTAGCPDLATLLSRYNAAHVCLAPDMDEREEPCRPGALCMVCYQASPEAFGG